VFSLQCFSFLLKFDPFYHSLAFCVHLYFIFLQLWEERLREAEESTRRFERKLARARTGTTLTGPRENEGGDKSTQEVGGGSNSDGMIAIGISE